MKLKAPILMLTLCAMLGPTVKAEVASLPEYRVTDVGGDAGFIPKGKTVVSPVVKNLTLESGDRLVTGKSGRIELATRQGTVMELKEESSLEVESFSSQVSRFFLKVGRLMGKFAPASKTKHAYSIRTPLAVASVRGTELALGVEENGETQGGVLEGEVAFGPALPSSEWSEGEIKVEETKGITVKPQSRPEKVSGVPPLLVNDLAWFPSVRERIPALRDQWKDLTPPAQQELRQKALRDRIQWKIPARIQKDFQAPAKASPPAPQRKSILPSNQK